MASTRNMVVLTVGQGVQPGGAVRLDLAHGPGQQFPRLSVPR
ncbi:hypothetical protein [Streptomyces cyaneogriseus]|nr:hypothetical protein [Streptomyces cyaneogriseus]